MGKKSNFKKQKQKMIEDNENQYGKEIREKYGNEAIDSSNAKIMKMGEVDYARAEQLNADISEKLKAAMMENDPAGELAQEVCRLHKESLCMFWKDGAYSKEAHKSLAEMYVTDERFKAYYDKIVDGGALFLRDAINIYCAE